MEKKEVISCSYSEIENLIKKNFNLPYEYEFLSSEICGNDTYKVWRIDATFDKWEEADLQEALKTQMNYRSRSFMKELCRRNIIEPGLYMIQISW